MFSNMAVAACWFSSESGLVFVFVFVSSPMVPLLGTGWGPSTVLEATSQGGGHGNGTDGLKYAAPASAKVTC